MILEFIVLAMTLLLFILIIPYIFRTYDHYDATASPQNYKSNILYDPYYDTHTQFPFWNTQLGSKRNMSYDLRGDAGIPYIMWTPFNMASTVPIRNKPLYLVS